MVSLVLFLLVLGCLCRVLLILVCVVSLHVSFIPIPVPSFLVTSRLIVLA